MNCLNFQSILANGQKVLRYIFSELKALGIRKVNNYDMATLQKVEPSGRKEGNALPGDSDNGNFRNPFVMLTLSLQYPNDDIDSLPFTFNG